MGIGSTGAIQRDLRTLFTLGTIGDLTDGQLLERFTVREAEVAELAFGALVERHGPMVLRVCRAVLRDPHEAEDAFQATFLVLVSKARSLWVKDSLGPWLQQVAFRVASSARSAATRRRFYEGRCARAESSATRFVESSGDLEGILHEEIGRLPTRYRDPVVLCDLEGRSHDQAARQLGCPVGTIKSRLARGRERLRDRLVRRGVTPALGLLASGFMSESTSAAMPVSLVSSTARAAVQLAAGHMVTGGVSVTAVSLMKGVEKSMHMSTMKRVMSIVLLMGAIATGAIVLAQQPASPPTPPTASIAPFSRPTPPDDSQVVYQVRFVELNGYGWRTTLTPRLKLLKREIPFTVWTADSKTFQDLVKVAGNVLQAPKVTAFSDTMALVGNQGRRHFVVDVKPGHGLDSKGVQSEVELQHVDLETLTK